MESYYTVREVADMFSVSPATVRGWIRSRQLRAIKLDGRRGWKITGLALVGFAYVARPFYREILHAKGVRLNPMEILALTMAPSLANKKTGL